MTNQQQKQVLDDLYRRMDDELMPIVHQVLKKYRKTAVKMPEITLDWSLSGRTAGQVQFRPGLARIRLNPALLTFPEHNFSELHDTLAHELAHVVVMLVNRKAPPHGELWREVAVALGAAPKASHRLPLAATRRTKEYRYRISGLPDIWLGSIRHSRLQKGNAIYRDRRHGRMIRASDYCGEWRWRPAV